jgi:chaperonin GroEL
VGGLTEVEMTERRHRIEDALEAVRSAQEEGIIGGGGAALLRASRSIAIISSGGGPGQGLGAAIIQEACKAPIQQMAINAGESPDLIVEKVINAESNQGWDFREGELIDLLKGGVIDPLKVTKTALEKAASCAGTLITTNFGIIQTE